MASSFYGNTSTATTPVAKKRAKVLNPTPPPRKNSTKCASRSPDVMFRLQQQNESLEETSFEEENNASPRMLRALTNVNDALRKRISLLESQIQNNNVRIENVESSLVDVNNKCANQFDDSKKGKLPPELTQLVRNAYRSIKDESTWNFLERFDSIHNSRITNLICQIVKDSNENPYAPSLMHRSCSRYYSTLKRKEKEEDNDRSELKRKRRRTTRRHRLYRQRSKYVPRDKADIWMLCNAEIMSDEHSDNEAEGYVHPPKFRSEEVTELLHFIDSKRLGKDELDARIPGSYSDRDIGAKVDPLLLTNNR